MPKPSSTLPLSVIYFGRRIPLSRHEKEMVKHLPAFIAAYPDATAEEASRYFSTRYPENPGTTTNCWYSYLCTLFPRKQVSTEDAEYFRIHHQPAPGTEDRIFPQLP